MGEKDNPFNYGDFKLGIFCEGAIKEIPIVDKSTLVAMDSINVSDSTEVEPIDVELFTAGSYSFNIYPSSRKDKVLYRWLVFGGRKPWGIKCPHKKRKIRILSKWINRYIHAYNYEK